MAETEFYAEKIRHLPIATDAELASALLVCRRAILPKMVSGITTGTDEAVAFCEAALNEELKRKAKSGETKKSSP